MRSREHPSARVPSSEAFGCRSSRELVAAVFELLDRAPSERGPMPVLARSAIHADHATLLAMCRERGAASSVHDRCCIVADDDPAALAGAAHALVSGKRLVLLRRGQPLSELAGELAAARSITIAMSAGRVRAVGCDELHDRLDGLGAPWGLLTGSDAAALSLLVARIEGRRPTASRRAILYQVDANAMGLGDDDDLRHVRLPAHPGEEMAGLTREPVQFAAFVGHGRSYCALAGNLCSRREPAAAGDRRCVGGFDCVFSRWSRVPARDLLAEVVLLDSCSTSSFRLFGPQVDDGLNLAVELLDGHACAVLSPRRTNVPLATTPYAIWALLRQGWSLGELARAMNRDIAAHYRGHHPFTLLGDPDMRQFPPPGREPPAATIREAAPGLWVLRLPPSSGTVDYHECGDPCASDLQCLASDAEAGPRSLQLLRDGADPGTVKIVGVWATPAERPAVELYLTGRPPFREEVIANLGALVENLRINREWIAELGDDGLPADEPPPLQAELERTLAAIQRSVVSHLETPTTDPRGYAALFEAERCAVTLSERIGDVMIANLADRARQRELWIRSHYARRQGIRRLSEAPAAPCPRCAGNVVEQRYQVGLWPSRVRRALECERCMTLHDVEEGELELMLEGPLAVTKAEAFELRVVGRNGPSGPASLRCALIVDRMGHPADLIEVTPRVQAGSVAAGGRFELDFRVVISGELCTHLFHAKALVIKNGAIGWALMKIIVRE